MSIRPRGPRIVALVALITFLVSGTALSAHAARGLPPKFENVSSSVSYVKLTVHTSFDGYGPVTLTVGTSPNVAATKWRSVTVTRGFTSAFTLVIDDLRANTHYYYMLTAAGALPYVSPLPVATPIRDVHVSFRRLHVVHDGDAWPAGCGDFHFTFDVEDWAKYTSEMCLDDGADVAVPNNHQGFEPGERQLDDYQDPSVGMSFWAQDDDRCNCAFDGDYCFGQNYDYQSTACGDLAYGFRTEDVRLPGQRHVNWEVIGEGVDVKTDYNITVKYHW